MPLGARVSTKNPKPWEFDDSLPEPDQSTWGKISITMFRSDGGIVDAEMLRPQSWIARHKIVAGQQLPMNIEELQVHGSAFVTAVDDCPEIARGEGSVVTARFITREVNSIVRAEIVGPDGKIEVIEGTPIHPIWSVDRNDWVPLGNLVEGETLQASGGIAKVSSLSLATCALPVYNIEVHGEHVYEVGEFGLLVHNADLVCRIGGGTADNLAMTAAELKLTPPGISSLVTNSADEAAALMRNAFPKATQLAEKAKTVGTTTIEDIKRIGFDIMFDPTRKFPDNHYRIFHPGGVDAFMQNLDELAKIFKNSTGH